ncbi:MAG: hypothetical protein ACOZCO_02760 [Bacteroidota bacterium]
MSVKKICIECREPIIGRPDKRFCSDQCRNAYNNKLNSDANNFVRNVNNTLRKNRRILSAVLGDNEKGKISKEKLMLQGYNFNYHTNTYTTKTGSVYYFCYEYGILPIEGDYFAVVLRKEYVS